MDEDKAIEILESQRLCGDDCSICEVYDYEAGIHCQIDKAINKAIEALRKQAEGKWIPVSERLPKTDEDVLVCNSQGAMEVCYYHIDDTVYPTEYADLNETGWYNENDDVLDFEPIAWMPLPQSYQAESEEESE